MQPAGLTEPDLGEFTRDGIQDLIGKDAQGIPWLFPGTAQNTWGYPTRIGNFTSTQRELTVGRVNRDDYDDLLTITSAGNVYVFYGKPEGASTAAGRSSAPASSPTTVT